jgi:Mn2+/Fe2+ NRAMP family transporter
MVSPAVAPPPPTTRAASAAERRQGRLGYYLRRIGPGFVTGAANDDPGAVGTHAAVGAQLGLGTLWLAVYTLPLTAVVLEMCAQIGNVAGRGFITILRFHYPRVVLWGVVALLAAANLVNLAADLAIMAASVQLLAGGPALPWLLALAAASAALQVFVPYAPYARVLKVLALSLFAYVVAVFLVPHDWPQVLKATLVPTLAWNGAFLTSLAAVLGTRLSPYVLVWQPAQVVEQQIDEGKESLQERLGATRREVRAVQLDVMTGSLVANLVTWAILATSAATLHARGITDVTTATQAAEALRPAAGPLAYVIFAVGILSTGLLAVPVLAGGIGYAVGEALGWERGLAREAGHAKGFYGVIVACIAAAVLLDLLGVNPIRALVLSQVLNAVVAVPLVFLVLRICNDRRIMGDSTNGRLANALGWGAFVVVAAVAAGALFGIAATMSS